MDETETKMEMDEDVKSQVEEEIWSNCQVVNKPTLKNDQLPSPYLHLGWATSEDETREKFHRQTEYLVSTRELDNQKVYHKNNPLKFSCRIMESCG